MNPGLREKQLERKANRQRFILKLRTSSIIGGVYGLLLQFLLAVAVRKVTLPKGEKPRKEREGAAKVLFKN